MFSSFLMFAIWQTSVFVKFPKMRKWGNLDVCTFLFLKKEDKLDIIFVFKHNIINTTNRMLPHLLSFELIFVNWSFKLKFVARKAQCKHDVLIWCFSMLLHSDLISGEDRLFIASSGFFSARPGFLFTLSARFKCFKCFCNLGKRNRCGGHGCFPSPKYVRVH